MSIRLVYCDICKTAFEPTRILSYCKCESSSAIIENDIIIYSGIHANPLKIDLENNYNYGSRYENELKGNKKAQQRDLCVKVIEFLNETAGTDFSTKFPSAHTTLILQRQKEHDCSFDDFKRIISNKCNQWLGTPQQEYLRPATLFNKTKFANYIGEKNYGKQPANAKSQLQSFAGVVEQAKRTLPGSCGNDVVAGAE